MPEEVRAILRELLEQGGASRWRLTGLDLHGRVGWFVDLLRLQRQAFEARDSSMQSLELSLVNEAASTTTSAGLYKTKASALAAGRRWVREH